MFILLAACRATPAGDPTPIAGSAPAVVGQVVNQVQLRASAVVAFQPAAAGAPLSSGSQLKTFDSSQARVDLQNGGLLRLAPNTELTLANVPAVAGDPALRVRLTAGKFWSGLPGSGLIASTPMGVVTIHANRASLEFVPGRLGDPADDVLIVNCLDGDCTLQTEALRENMAGLEQLVITGGSRVIRFTLRASALQDFLVQNPESASLPIPTPGTAIAAITSSPATERGLVTPTLPSAQTSTTWTPLPTVDTGAAQPSAASDAVWLRIGLFLAAMFLVVMAALSRLRGRSRHEP